MNIGEFRYIEIDGMKMHYLEAGKGEPLDASIPTTRSPSRSA